MVRKKLKTWLEEGLILTFNRQSLLALTGEMRFKLYPAGKALVVFCLHGPTIDCKSLWLEIGIWSIAHEQGADIKILEPSSGSPVIAMLFGFSMRCFY